jgi:hypothetical protein
MVRKSIVAAPSGFMLAPVVNAGPMQSAAHPLESIRFEADSDVSACYLPWRPVTQIPGHQRLS